MSELRYVVAPITRVEVRDPTRNDDNTWTMSGYAAVFNQTTTLYDGRFVQIDEKIDPQAFSNVFQNQRMGEPSGVVHFNFGHDMNRAVAATDVTAGQPGSLNLSTDSQGLRFLAKVARDDPDGVALASKMRTGVVKQASFAFTIGKLESVTTDDEENDKTHYSDTIMSVRHLYDVCACAQGAYSQTVSGLRSYAAMLGQPDRPDPKLTSALAALISGDLGGRVGLESKEEGGHRRQPDLGGANAVNPSRGGGGDITPSRDDFSLDAILARAERLRPIAVDLTGRNRDAPRGREDSDDSHV